MKLRRKKKKDNVYFPSESVTDCICLLIRFYFPLLMFLISSDSGGADSNEWLFLADRYCCFAPLPNKAGNYSVFACRHIKNCVLTF